MKLFFCARDNHDRSDGSSLREHPELDMEWGGLVQMDSVDGSRQAIAEQGEVQVLARIRFALYMLTSCRFRSSFLRRARVLVRYLE